MRRSRRVAATIVTATTVLGGAGVAVAAVQHAVSSPAAAQKQLKDGALAGYVSSLSQRERDLQASLAATRELAAGSSPSSADDATPEAGDDSSAPGVISTTPTPGTTSATATPRPKRSHDGSDDATPSAIPSGTSTAADDDGDDDSDEMSGSPTAVPTVSPTHHEDDGDHSTRPTVTPSPTVTVTPTVTLSPSGPPMTTSSPHPTVEPSDDPTHD